MSGAIDLSRLVQKAKGNIDKAVQQTVVLAARGVIMGTPVDSGALRGSWTFGVGQPASVHNTAEDKAGGATLTKIAAAVVNEKAGPSFFITTNLPYARRIEYEGWSKQAPQGMVRLTLENLPTAIRRYVATLK